MKVHDVAYQAGRITRALKLLGRLGPEIGQPQTLAMQIIAEALEDLVALAHDVRSMREQAIARQTWYTFTTCEYGEAVDESLARVFGWPLSDEGILLEEDVPPMQCRELELEPDLEECP